MNIKRNALCLCASLALSSFLTKPLMADDWNKRTEFTFSAPVEVPGKLLRAGKYVFELVDNESDRNIVQIFSEDSNGKESLVTTIMAIPGSINDTPDKPTIHFEERPAGGAAAVAIHSWYYPGENTGWEFVYPKGQTMETSANTTAAPAPVTPTAAPIQPPADQGEPAAKAEPADQDQPAPKVQEEGPAPEVTVEEEVVIAQNEAPAPTPAQETGTSQTLPQTAGYSDLQLITGLLLLGAGAAAVFVSHRKSQA